MAEFKKTFLLDVDGVLTTGKFLYSIEGKMFKEFGPHDHDGLKLLKNLINIKFITCDLSMSMSQITLIKIILFIWVMALVI